MLNIKNANAEIVKHFKIIFSKERGSYHFSDSNYEQFKSIIIIRQPTPAGTYPISLTFSESPTGCGFAIMNQTVNLRNFTKEELNHIWEFLKGVGIGCIITTLGNSFEEHFSHVIENGFVEAACYSNYYHNSGYKQRLFFKTF